MFRTRLTSMFPLHLAPDAPAGTVPPVETTAQRVNKVAARFITLHGSEEAAIAALARENVTITDDLATERTRVTELRGKVPDPEKMVVLPKERVETFNKFEALKLSPEDVTKLQTRNTELEGSVRTFGVKEIAAKGAPVLGYDPEATVDLIGRHNLHVELREQEREVTKDGKKEKVKLQVPFVRPAADDKAQLVALDEHVAKLPAFEQRAVKAVAPQGGQQQQQSQQQTGGSSSNYIEQGRAADGGDSGAAQTALGRLAERYPTPSEMRAKKEQTHAA